MKHELIGKYFPVLDHGFVALVDFMGVVEAARTSFGFGTKSTSEERILLRYLYRHRHTTPFEMVELKFHVKLPIFVARQLIRHRTAAVNEYSLRYSLAPILNYMPTYESFRKQSTTNKQGRGEQADREQYDRFVKHWTELREEAASLYGHALEEDIARELARIDLPLSLYTEWYWKIDLHNLLGFLKLRADSHAQEEIQAYARVKAGIAKILCPDSFEAWIDYSFAAASFSRMERWVLHALMNQLPLVSPDVHVLCQKIGMSNREIQEFGEKMKAPEEPPSFDLDLLSAKTAEFFYEEARAAVPQIKPKQ